MERMSTAESLAPTPVSTPARKPVPTSSVMVLIPALNEAASIGDVVAATRRCAEPLAEMGLGLSVCVIDDGSTDGTGAAARTAGADHVLKHGRNMGVGAAVRTGLIYARTRGFGVAVKLDGDGQHDPIDIPALIRPILDERADVVYGNRFSRIDYRMPLYRRAGNAVFRHLMRWLTGWDIEDSQPGMFAVNRSYLTVSFIPGDYNYTQQVLLDSYLKGMRFEQAPISFHRRQSGESFISLQYPFRVLSQILVLMVMIRPLKIFLPLATFFLGTGALIGVVELGMWAAGIAERPIEHVNLVLGLAMFGLNTGFFGLLAEAIARRSS
ncbi:MAG: glycosyltransferase family 2 protein [Acidobacteria bacterium]|nr:glycosyltransferase family 2 protein [Acidobacteriota bacterium]MYJ05993.1 glycosyltransferase family 2 protein [Acidobacteriota bacterium]